MRARFAAWLAGVSLVTGSALAVPPGPATAGPSGLAPTAALHPGGALIPVRSSDRAKSRKESKPEKPAKSSSSRKSADSRSGKEASPAKESSRGKGKDRNRDAGPERNDRSGRKGRDQAQEREQPGKRNRDPRGTDPAAGTRQRKAEEDSRDSRGRRRSSRDSRDRADDTPEPVKAPERRSARRDTNRASPSSAPDTAATLAPAPSGPPRERPGLASYDDTPPAYPSASTGLVPNYLPAPAPEAPVTPEEFERAFPGLAGLAPCDAVERLRATLRLRGVNVSQAAPDIVRPFAAILAVAGHAGQLRAVASRHRDTNTARKGTDAKERKSTKGSSSGSSSSGRDRDSSGRSARTSRERDRGRGRDTGKARGSAREERPDDRRRRRRAPEAPLVRDDGPPVGAGYVPPALSTHVYKIPSPAIVARIRELQPACADQRIAERAERDASQVQAPAPARVSSAPDPEPIPAVAPTPRAAPAPAPLADRPEGNTPDAVYQAGSASWYGRLFHGRRTASGERYDMFKYTAAHLKLPLGTYIRVWRRDHRNSVVVKVNDRGPYHGGRILDLSYAAAQVLGISGAGTGQIEIELLDRRTGNTTLAREEAVFTSRRLEAGAFTDPADAEVRRQTLADAGFADAQVVAVPSAGLFAVRVGPYASASTLEAARRRIERLGLIVEAVPD